MPPITWMTSGWTISPDEWDGWYERVGIHPVSFCFKEWIIYAWLAATCGLLRRGTSAAGCERCVCSFRDGGGHLIVKNLMANGHGNNSCANNETVQISLRTRCPLHHCSGLDGSEERYYTKNAHLWTKWVWKTFIINDISRCLTLF